MTRIRFGATAVALLAALAAAAPASAGDVLRLRPGALAFARASNVAPVTWCGSGPSPVDRQPSVELSSANQVHVVYAVPADGADRFASLASPIATDIAAIDAWWRIQDPTRAPRWDFFAFPGCTTRFGDLDIGYARLPRPASDYGGVGGELRLGADLDAFAQSPKTKNLVFYDGSLDEPAICGSTDFLAAQDGGRYGFAFVYLRSACPNDTGRGAFTARVAAHELLHNLGGEPAGGPPHECAPPNSGHPCDSTSDILFPFVTFGDTLDSAVLDVGRDDYYGHSGWWWDVQDSLWLMHLPQFALTLSVGGSGGATGTIGMTLPADASCASTCTEELDNGTRVALVARPAKGARFVGWSGACSGAGPCTPQMDAARSVTAEFAPAPAAVKVTRTGRGTVTSAPAGIACPGKCSASFVASSIVLRAKPAKGYRFAGWTGDCRGTGACSLTGDADHAVGAVFKKRPRR
jgi:hypothetical protein